MRHTSIHSFGFVVVAALLIVTGLVWPANVVAQVDTGTLHVEATDPDGAPLPGVTVTVEGPQGTTTKVTEVGGNTRFPALRPGSYDVTFQLQGFSTVIRQGLRITAGGNLVIAVTLELAGVEETVSVTGESPVVDVKATGTGAVYDRDLMDKAPNASGVWAGVLDHIPGVVNGEFDIGGAESGQQALFSSRGSARTENNYMVNGGNTGCPQSLGATAIYYSTDAMEEVQVSTGAHDIEFQRGGVALNMVTKSGSNDFHGGVTFYIEDSEFVSDNLDQDLRDQGATTSPGLERLEDLDLQVGGPIVEDRAWFFVDYWDFSTDTGRVGLPEGIFDDTTLENWILRGSVQVTPDLKVSSTYMTNRKFRAHRPVGENFAQVPIESMWIQDSFVDIPQVNGQLIVAENGFLDVRFSKMDIEFPLERRPDAPDADPILDLTTGNWSGPPLQELNFQRDRTQWAATYSHFLSFEEQSHDLKLGFDFQKGQKFEPSVVARGLNRFDLGDEPLIVRLFNSPAFDDPKAAIFDRDKPNADLVNVDELAIFGQDTWTFKNVFTVTAGVRWDSSEGSLDGQNRLESFWPQLGPRFQRAEFSERGQVTDWSEVQPRIGVIYDVLGDGRWAVKFNFARYTSAQPLDHAAFVNRNSLGFQDYLWNDDDGNGSFDFGEQTTLLGQSFPGSNTAIADDFKAPITQEFTLGFEHELIDDMLVKVTGIVRSAEDLIDTINVGVPFDFATGQGGDNFSPVPVVDPGPDGVEGTADDGDMFILWSQDPDTLGQDFLERFNPEQRGLRLEQNYRGIELTTHKRWSDNWQVLASLTVSETEATVNGGETAEVQAFNDAEGLFADPNNLINADGETFFSRRYVAKVTGNYLLPEPIGVNLGVFYRHLSGRPFTRTFPTGEALAQGNIQIRAHRRGEVKLEAVDILDFRAAKEFVLPGGYGSVHGYFDWFNLFNDNSVTARIAESGPNFDNVADFIQPRVFRLGARWQF